MNDCCDVLLLRRNRCSGMVADAVSAYFACDTIWRWTAADERLVRRPFTSPTLPL